MAQPNVNPHREATEVIETQRVHSGATKADAERNYAALIKAFEEMKAGYKRRGRSEVYSSGPRTLVISFAANIGTGTTTPIIQYFDGAITISGNGQLGRRLPHALVINSGDVRDHLMTDCDQLAILNRAPKGRVTSESIANGSEKTVYEEMHDDHGFRWVVTRSASNGCLHTAVKYRLMGGGAVLGDEIRVSKSGTVAGRVTPTRFEIVRRIKGEISRHERYNLLKSGLSMPALATMFPTGTPVNDYRFGSRPANYRWDGRLPSESEVAELGGSSAPIRTSSRIGVPIAGIGLLLIGAAIWLKRRPPAEPPSA